MEKSDKKDKILLVRHLGRITSWLKGYVDSFFGRATEVTAALQATDDAVKAAEAQRVSEEKQRHNEEFKRRGHETQRKNAETERIAAETERIAAETERVAAETSRAEAETQRDEAEKERARVFATYEATINDLQTRLAVLESKRSIILEE